MEPKFHTGDYVTVIGPGNNYSRYEEWARHSIPSKEFDSWKSGRENCQPDGEREALELK